MVRDEHNGADDVADANDDSEAVIHDLAPIFIAQPRAGPFARGAFGAVAAVLGLGMGRGGGGVVAQLVLAKDERRILDRRDRGARGILSRGGRGRGKRLARNQSATNF